MIIKNTHLELSEVESLLAAISNCYNPPLGDVVDLKVYSKKLYHYACFIVCSEESSNKIWGFMAYYKNQKTSQIYITQFCVDTRVQHQGIGGKMLDYLVRISKEGYSTMALEVDKLNNKAYRFYIKNGFCISEDRGSKYLMLKKI